MAISNFCEKQFVLNDASLIVQNPTFLPDKTQIVLTLCFNNISTTRVYNLIRIDEMLSVSSRLIQP